MKAMDEAKSILRKQLVAKKHELAQLEADVYKLEAAISSLEGVTTLKRIRRVSYDKVCTFCHEKFKAKKEDTTVCGKRECLNANNRARRKGMTLIAGDNTKA